MDMHGAHDMDMNSGMTSMYPENRVYAQEFWYIIAAATAIFACVRIGRAMESRSRYSLLQALRVIAETDRSTALERYDYNQTLHLPERIISFHKS